MPLQRKLTFIARCTCFDWRPEEFFCQPCQLPVLWISDWTICTFVCFNQRFDCCYGNLVCLSLSVSGHVIFVFYEFSISPLEHSTQLEFKRGKKRDYHKLIVMVDGFLHLQKKVFVYYQLTNFYQNHRRYVGSRNVYQLNGDDVKPRELKEEGCITTSTSTTKINGKLVGYAPCGAIANTLFNGIFVGLWLLSFLLLCFIFGFAAFFCCWLIAAGLFLTKVLSFCWWFNVGFELSWVQFLLNLRWQTEGLNCTQSVSGIQDGFLCHIHR